MARGESIQGKRFGRLIAVSESDQRQGRKIKWLCRCDCGNECLVRRSDLVSGNTKSCGCLAGEVRGKASITHGMTGTAIYNRWGSMIQRCKSDPHYTHVNVCERWASSFEAFYEDMGDIPEGASIERIDQLGDYEPENCVWATDKQQANNRRTSKIVEYMGARKTLMQWSDHLGFDYDKVKYRLNRLGWSVEKAFET